MKALVTGASSGIGRDIARLLNEKEYDLVLVARNEERLNQIKSELEQQDKNNKIEIISIDLAKKENCLALCKKVKNVDILINNAGFGDCGYFSETDLDKELNMINTNITAVHILTKLYLQEMKKRNSGKILNVASIAGFMPGPLMSTYYATKSYIVRLSQGIREELHREHSKVQISILCPGPVNTNFNNVAGVEFHLREANSMSVAKQALNGLEKGKFCIVPGIDIKLAMLAAKLIPSFIVGKVTYLIQWKKLRKGK